MSAIRVTVDTASPMVRALAAGLTVAQSGPVAGRAVANRVREHLFAYNEAHPNQLGGKRTNFYTQAARSTQMQPTANGALVSINHLGFRLQLQGGTVRPVKGRYLTIPAVPEAHAKAAREFGDLDFAFVPDGGKQRAALVQARQTKIKVTKTKKGPKVKPVESTLGTKVIYWLVRKAQIPAHADLLPTEAELGEAATTALASLAQRTIERQSKGAQE